MSEMLDKKENVDLIQVVPNPGFSARISRSLGPLF
jgi:hypothetical protein